MSQTEKRNEESDSKAEGRSGDDNLEKSKKTIKNKFKMQNERCVLSINFNGINKTVNKGREK
ncbi:hypothetical protein ACT7DB_01060 [Bacillus cereus]